MIKVTNLEVGAYGDDPVDVTLGPDPATTEFGGQVFASDPGTEGPWYAGGLSAEAHSEYWNPQSKSLINMGRIIAGSRRTDRRTIVTNRTWTAAAVIVAGLTMTACGTDSGAGMKPTITIAEANTRVDDYIARAVKALPPQATLELNLQERSGDCSDPTDRGPKNRVVANRGYKVHGLDRKQIPSYFTTIRSWALTNGFRVLDDKPVNEFLSVENNTDAFQLAFTANFNGGIFLSAGSPCVWPNGTPEPSAAALGEADSSDTAAAPSEPQPAVAAPEASKPRPVARRQPPAQDEDVEDFDQRDWTDESAY